MREKVISDIKYRIQCDECSTVNEGTLDTFSGWVSIKEVSDNGVRLFERIDKVKTYDTSNLGQRKHKDFCSKSCLLLYLNKSTGLFVAELFNLSSKNSTPIM